MKIVYVTGCLGFIGGHITRRLLGMGWYVKGIDKCTYACDNRLLDEFNQYQNFSFEKKDINDLKFLYDCDYIINTAAETHVGNSIVNSEEFIRSNVMGVYNILELMRNYRSENGRTPTLVHTSTDECYGDIGKGTHKETDFLKPSNPYSSSKSAADMLISGWGRTYGLPYIIVRPTNNYGIGQYVEKLIPKAIKYLSFGRKVPLHNLGLPVRNWLHAEDTTSAIITLIEKGSLGEIYNVCGGFELNNNQVVNKICFLMGKKFEDNVDYTLTRQGQDIRYSLNDDKLRALGWKPEKNFDDELKGIVEYYHNRFIW
jgi:dTDP-glucose 4,6-dehydratase